MTSFTSNADYYPSSDFWNKQKATTHEINEELGRQLWTVEISMRRGSQGTFLPSVSGRQELWNGYLRNHGIVLEEELDKAKYLAFTTDSDDDLLPTLVEGNSVGKTSWKLYNEWKRQLQDSYRWKRERRAGWSGLITNHDTMTQAESTSSR